MCDTILAVVKRGWTGLSCSSKGSFEYGPLQNAFSRVLSPKMAKAEYLLELAVV